LEEAALLAGTGSGEAGLQGGSHGCACNVSSLHPDLKGILMRAEIQAIVDEIKQSVGLLRRHL
jgi:hypothetical protein